MKIDDHLAEIQQRTAASVTNPAAGVVALFVDSANGHYSQKDSTGAVIDLAAAGGGSQARHILFRVLSKTTSWPANGTTVVGGDLVIPFAGTITDIEADVDVAGVTGTATVDVNLNGATIMTTNKLNWDSGEKSTRTFSGAAPGLTTTAVALGDIITLDIDTNHTGTAAQGLTLYIGITQS